MFSGRNMIPWHGLGTVIAGMVTAKEALSLAHLDWEVQSVPVTVNGRQLPFPNGETADCYQGIVRADTGDCLGVMKGRYTPIQNAESFDFFDALIGQGKACYDTAGALRGGKQVWLLAKVDGEINICGDQHRQWALMLTSHDGSYALQVSWVLERVVCANTLAVALRGATDTCKIRHTANWADKEAEAARVLGLGEHYFKSIQDKLSALNSLLLTPEQMNQFSELLIPSKPGEEPSTRTKNIRSEIADLFQTGSGNHGASRWDALQAVTDYADHRQTVRGENSTRLESAVMGSAAQLKQRAFDMLTSEDLMDQLLNRPVLTIGQNPVESPDFNRLIGK